MLWQNTFSTNDNYKRALNTRGNLVFRYRIYHPKQSLTFLFYFRFLLLHFVSSFPFTIYKQLVRKEVFPVVAWNIANCSQSCKDLQAVISRWVAERARSKFISGSFKSKLNSGSSDEKEMILKQNLDVLAPEHIGTINFACHFLEQIQRADWGVAGYQSLQIVHFVNIVQFMIVVYCVTVTIPKRRPLEGVSVKWLGFRQM